MLLTNRFGADVSEPMPSEANISKDLDEPPLCGKVGMDITSPGVWVEGDEGELGKGPVVFAVPELLAGPEDDTGCFLFCPTWHFGVLNGKSQRDREREFQIWTFSNDQVHHMKRLWWITYRYHSFFKKVTIIISGVIKVSRTLMMVNWSLWKMTQKAVIGYKIMCMALVVSMGHDRINYPNKLAEHIDVLNKSQTWSFPLKLFEMLPSPVMLPAPFILFCCRGWWFEFWDCWLESRSGE